MKREGWRTYQANLQRKTRLRNSIKRLPRIVLYVILGLLFFTGSWLFAHLGLDDHPLSSGDPDRGQGGRRDILDKKDLPDILGYPNLNDAPDANSFSLKNQGKPVTVETYFNNQLQRYVQRLLSRSLTHQAAVVVMRPDNGQVLVLSDYRKEKQEGEKNLCLEADFPAASLFKIISAAAAIEAKGFTPDKPLYFRGMKHTLYKNQLKKEVKIGRYTNKTNFKKSFSGSINPVFGKIGIHDLGRDLLVQYAERFLFNRSIPFDIPLEMSRIEVPENDFGLAEIASGFNKRTLVSPLHAALIVSVVANKGIMMVPNVVWRIIDHRGRLIYAAKQETLVRAIDEKTAKEMKTLMRETVIRGTCRKAFLPLRRKKMFKNIELGAKTGTINDPSDRFKFDWLTAYALPEEGKKGIVISVMAVHGEKLGIRSNEMARYIIDKYFSS